MYGIYEVHLRTRKYSLVGMRPSEKAAAAAGRKLIAKRTRRYRRRYAITIQAIRAPEQPSAMEMSR